MDDNLLLSYDKLQTKMDNNDECFTAIQQLYWIQSLAVRTYIEQIIDIFISFLYLDVLVYNNSSYISTFPYAQLSKWHNILSLHFVCNIATQGFINNANIPFKYNLPDGLLNHWSHQASYKNLIEPLLHYDDDVDQYCMIKSIEISFFLSQFSYCSTLPFMWATVSWYRTLYCSGWTYNRNW